MADAGMYLVYAASKSNRSCFNDKPRKHTHTYADGDTVQASEIILEFGTKIIGEILTHSPSLYSSPVTWSGLELHLVVG